MELFEKNADPYPFYRDMRDREPVRFHPEKRFWEFFRYQDIQTILRDPASFSSELFHAIGKPELQTMVMMDPPRHTKMRALLAKAFTMKMVNAQAAGIAAITNELLDAVLDKGEIDLAQDLAFPLPAGIIGGMLGLPKKDIIRLKNWAIAAVQVAETTMRAGVPSEQLLASVKEMTDYFAEIAQERKAHPGEDLISALVQAEVDGEHLSIEEISNTCKLTAVAGFDTTTIFILNALHILLQQEQLKDQVLADPALLETFLEEVLRYAPPFQSFARIAKRDVEVGGHLIKAGQWVVTYNASGNRDEAAFENGEEFIPTRSPNRHLSFGHGIHFCLGAPLGRLEAKIAIPAIFARLPKLRLNPQQPGVRLGVSVQFGFSSLPAIFER